MTRSLWWHWSVCTEGAAGVVMQGWSGSNYGYGGGCRGGRGVGARAFGERSVVMRAGTTPSNTTSTAATTVIIIIVVTRWKCLCLHLLRLRSVRQ